MDKVKKVDMEKMTVRDIFSRAVTTAHFGRFLANEIFRMLLLVYLLLYLLEQYVPGFVTYSVNLTWMLVVVIVTGCIGALFPEKNVAKQQNTPLRIRDYVFVILLAVAGGVLVYVKVKSMGAFSIPLSILSALIIALLSVLLMTDKEDDTE